MSRPAAALLLAILSSCGSNEASLTRPGPDIANLRVEVRSGPETSPRIATLRCGTPNEGSGFLTPAMVAEACELITRDDEEHTKRLQRGQPKNQVCTEIYGGPQRAHVTGTLLGVPVDTEFHRADGCGIADWKRFESLLGSPEG